MTITNEQELIDAEDVDDSKMFLDALLNGDPTFNKFVKMVDRRFESQARRTNNGRKEVRDEMKALRKELGPVIEFARAFKYYAAAGGVIGTIGSLIVGAIALGVFP